MARQSSKILQTVELQFESSDLTYHKDIEIRWTKKGNEPGRFLVEEQILNFDGVQVRLSAVKSTDIGQLLELITGAVNSKLNVTEPLRFEARIDRKLATRKEIVPSHKDLICGWGEINLEQHICFLAYNKIGRPYQADDINGHRTRMITDEGAETIKRDTVVISVDQMKEIKEQLRQFHESLDREVKTVYSTFRSQVEALLEHHITSMIEEEQASQPNDQDDYSTVLSRLNIK